jgi:hypothetical protein
MYVPLSGSFISGIQLRLIDAVLLVVYTLM